MSIRKNITALLVVTMIAGCIPASVLADDMDEPAGEEKNVETEETEVTEITEITEEIVMTALIYDKLRDTDICGAGIGGGYKGDGNYVEINGGMVEVETSFASDDGTVSGSVVYSPLTYCCTVLNAGTYGSDLENVCRALYVYYDEVMKY